jgi:hypothetical protein
MRSLREDCRRNVLQICYTFPGKFVRRPAALKTAAGKPAVGSSKMETHGAASGEQSPARAGVRQPGSICGGSGCQRRESRSREHLIDSAGLFRTSSIGNCTPDGNGTVRLRPLPQNNAAGNVSEFTERGEALSRSLIPPVHLLDRTTVKIQTDAEGDLHGGPRPGDRTHSGTLRIHGLSSHRAVRSSKHEQPGLRGSRPIIHWMGSGPHE